jgi:eukaryotic-like serine/threonine-protein kinase
VAEPIVLKERVEIDADRPLPEFNIQNAAAYAAKARRESQGELVAYACDPRIPHRHEDLETMRGFSTTGLIRFVEWGVVTWRPLNRRLAVVVYEKPMGGRLASKVSDTIEPMSDEVITRNFLTPAMGVLRDMSARGVPHRAIRPDNLFYSDTGKRHIILGDALTAPPGLHNPAFCETLEQGMADPEARGRGGVSDDLYAIGVCVIFLLLGRNPLHAMSTTEVVERKIAMSSYSALTGGARIQMNMVELLRGLLADDPKDRWSVREVELWIGGRRLTPKQAKLPPKAARPINIAGRDHDNVRSVADGLGRNWLVSGEVVRGQDFDNWIRRSLTDERVTDAVNKTLGSQAILAKTPDSENPRLVTRACMALDPTAPLRHKGFSAHVDGVGTALAIGFDREDIRQKVADFINGKFIGAWMSLQTRNRADLNEMYGLFDKLPVPLNMTGIGYGIERVLYELNKHLHCQSPLIEPFFVTTIDRLIPALEGASKGRDRPRLPVDRHIAAFAAARTADVDERHLRALSNNNQGGTDHILAALSLLGRIQTMSKNGPAPTLAAWFADLMEPAVNSFHNLKQRKAIEANVARAAETGMLMELQAIYSDQKAIQRDQHGYAQAQQEHRYCGAQIEQLTLELNNREHMATELGEQVAAVTSGVVGSLGSTSIIVMFML